MSPEYGNIGSMKPPGFADGPPPANGIRMSMDEMVAESRRINPNLSPEQYAQMETWIRSNYDPFAKQIQGGSMQAPMQPLAPMPPQGYSVTTPDVPQKPWGGF
jgi:hypothetical protein